MKCSDISLDEGWGWWRQRRVAGDACRSPSHFRCWPFSTLWGMGNPWKVKRKLVFNFVCWLDCLCVSLSLVETTSHRAQAGLDPVILSPSLPERGNGNCITMPVFYGTLRINAGLGAFVWKAVDKILANRIYLYLCVFRKYTIWKESQKWE